MRLAVFRPVLRIHGEGDEAVLKPDATEQRPLDDYHRHEVLDRKAIFADQFETHVASHPVIEFDPALRAQATEIADRLAELYQSIGRIADHLNA